MVIHPPIVNFSSIFKNALLFLGAIFLLSFQLPAQAASLGRLTLHSGLGEPLRAEIEIVSPPEKMHSLLVELASREDFKNAGIEYLADFRHLRMSLGSNESGRPVVRLTTSKPLNSPQQSLLLELRWASGRQVREFTFSLARGDNPAVVRNSPTMPMGPDGLEVPRVPPLVIEERPLTTAMAPINATEAEAVAVLARKFRQEPAVHSEPRTKKDGKLSASVASVGAGRRVRPGETLYRIALESKPAQVNIEEMLVGLYQRNPEAFFDKNINRLRTGAILQMPDERMLAETRRQDVKKILVTHHQAWHQYRQTLAAGVSASAHADGSRHVGGKISALVEEVVLTPEKTLDRVEVSASPLIRDAVDRAQEIAIQKDKQESAERIVALEKNITLLQQLLETKEAALALSDSRAGGVDVGITATGSVLATPAVRDESSSFYFWLGLLALCTTTGFALIWRQSQRSRSR